MLADVATSIQELDRQAFAGQISEMEAKLAEKEGSELDRALERRPLQEHRASAQFDGAALDPFGSTKSEPRLYRLVRRVSWCELESASLENATASARKSREVPRHGPIHVAAERHDEIGDTVEPLPAPGIEFRRLAVARRQWIDSSSRPVKRSANHFWRWPRNFASRCDAARRKAESRKSANRSRRDRRRSPRRSLPRVRASPPRASPRPRRRRLAASAIRGPGRMISGPSSRKRRPISTWPAALNSAMPTLGR